MGNLRYDLQQWKDWMEEGPSPTGGHITVSCSDGSHVMRLITNSDGDGLWMRTEGPSGPDYRQVAGTCEFSLPGSAQYLRRLMHQEFFDMEHMCKECGMEMPGEFFYSRRAAR